MILLAAASMAFVLFLVLTRPTAGQQVAGYVAARTADGRPNLSGVWQALNEANYDIQAHVARPALAVTPGPLGPVPAAPVLALGAIGGIPASLGVVEGGELPYQPWAAAKKKENFDNVLARDPEIRCYLPGVPRATYMPYPFQILQGKDKIMIVYAFAGATRTIHLDKEKVPSEAPAETWMGYSVGRWEGESLVVDVNSFNDQTWFDRAGNFHSDALRVTERYTATSPDRLMYEATIDDPKVFTRPWTMRMPIYRRAEENSQVLEYRCVDFVEELMYGHLRRQPVGRHWEANLGEPAGTLILDVTRRDVPLAPTVVATPKNDVGRSVR
jgi:hypothetical protein